MSIGSGVIGAPGGIGEPPSNIGGVPGKRIGEEERSSH